MLRKLIENKWKIEIWFLSLSLSPFSQFSWCGPCKQLTPRLETIIGGQSTKVDLAKVDVDELEQLAAEYQVQTIPAIFAIKNGKIIDQFVGRRDDDELKSFIDGALAK